LQKVSSFNSLDLELHALASLALGIRRRAYDEAPAAPTPAPAQPRAQSGHASDKALEPEEAEAEAEGEGEAWTDAFVAVYGEVGERNRGGGAACGAAARARSNAYAPAADAVGVFSAVLAALRALYGADSTSGESPAAASAALAEARRGRARGTEERPTFFAYTADELAAVERES
jgi:hypothetical protein